LIKGPVPQSTPRKILRWAVQEFGSELAVACSFGGLTGTVVLDMLVSIDRSIPVYYLDTGLLFPETYEHIRTVSAYYGIAPIAVRPALSVAQQNDEYGSVLWDRDPDTCCALRKVAPQREFLQHYRAWVTGLRRDQSSSRKDVETVAYDTKFDLTKISPFAAWTEQHVWEYVREHGVPYNPLLERGYASVGCIPCTRVVRPGEEARAGRWSGSVKTECGLHV
jgi:phosphoadenosine phosphosulfate reductase